MTPKGDKTMALAVDQRRHKPRGIARFLSRVFGMALVMSGFGLWTIGSTLLGAATALIALGVSAIMAMVGLVLLFR